MSGKKQYMLKEWKIYDVRKRSRLPPLQHESLRGTADLVVIASDEDAVAQLKERWLQLQMQGHLLSSDSEAEWLIERARFSLLSLRDCVEVNPNKRGGVPVLRGTRFTVAQLFAEIGEGRSIGDIAEDFELDLAVIKELFESFSIQLDRPFAT
jgi:uncharacterized protein (DUF433 family)